MGGRHRISSNYSLMLLSNLALVRGLNWFGYFLKFKAAKFCQFNFKLLHMEYYMTES